MDKSEKYIEMCKQTIEIQKLWKRDDGDFAYTDGDLDSYQQSKMILSLNDQLSMVEED